MSTYRVRNLIDVSVSLLSKARDKCPPIETTHPKSDRNRRCLSFIPCFGKKTNGNVNQVSYSVTTHLISLIHSHSKHTTLFQCCNNVVDVQKTLLQRQSDAVCLLGWIIKRSNFYWRTVRNDCYNQFCSNVRIENKKESSSNTDYGLHSLKS